MNYTWVRSAAATPRLAVLAMLVTACGSAAPLSSQEAPRPTTSTTIESTTFAPETTSMATTAPVPQAEPTTTTTTAATEVPGECEALVAEGIARMQGIIDASAAMSLRELANLPDAPTVIEAWWEQEPVLVEGTFIPTEELPPERVAEIEAEEQLYETCYPDIYLTPFRHADRLDLKSAAGAIAWTQDFAITTFIPFDFQFSPEGQAEIEALFGDPLSPNRPTLADPDGLSCSSLQEVVMQGAQTLIDTYSFGTYEFSEETETWITNVDQAATEGGCGELFFARTVASNGHTLTAGDMIAVPIRAVMISAAWKMSWESFRS